MVYNNFAGGTVGNGITTGNSARPDAFNTVNDSGGQAAVTYQTRDGKTVGRVAIPGTTAVSGFVGWQDSANTERYMLVGHLTSGGAFVSFIRTQSGAGGTATARARVARAATSGRIQLYDDAGFIGSTTSKVTRYDNEIPTGFVRIILEVTNGGGTNATITARVWTDITADWSDPESCNQWVRGTGRTVATHDHVVFGSIGTTQTTLDLLEVGTYWDPPPAFDPVNLQYDEVNGQVTLTWDASTTPGVTQYAVHRRTPSTGEPFDPENSSTEIGRTSNLTLVDNPGSGEFDYQVFGVIEA